MIVFGLSSTHLTEGLFYETSHAACRQTGSHSLLALAAPTGRKERRGWGGGDKDNRQRELMWDESNNWEEGPCMVGWTQREREHTTKSYLSVSYIFVLWYTQRCEVTKYCT